ncbi:hypothetical protein [Phaeodactylibacter xiamenensis]|uniref:hypothetical protein n=1 Tax=Phaeodactylibacter xiamenensis TaxID=1524460 RepID=UPI003BADA5CC
MKKILGVGIDLGSKKNVDTVGFNDLFSMSDYDIVIFHPKNITTFYPKDTIYNPYKGKSLLSKNSSVQLRDKFKYLKDEINNFLEIGNSIFVIMPKPEEFYAYPADIKPYTGTEDSEKLNNYSFLPIQCAFNFSKGKTTLPDNQLIKAFHKDFYEDIEYSCAIVIEEKAVRNLLLDRNKSKVVSSVIYKNKGAIVLLPTFQNKSFLFAVEGNSKIATLEEETGKRLLQHIVKLDKEINTRSEITPPPSWIDQESYELKESTRIDKMIQLKNKKIEEIKSEISELEINLKEERALLGLLYETGKSLEKSVIMALHLLGYKAENYDDGVLELDQVILSPENKRYIGECEGKDNKAIHIGKFRQLNDLILEDYEREDVEEMATGILFGNPQRLLDPKTRDVDFTQKCVSGAEREKIALIKTPDLFHVARYVKESDDLEYAKKCRDAINDQLGRVVIFPALPDKNEHGTS